MLVHEVLYLRIWNCDDFISLGVISHMILCIRHYDEAHNDRYYQVSEDYLL